MSMKCEPHGWTRGHELRASNPNFNDNKTEDRKGYLVRTHVLLFFRKPVVPFMSRNASLTLWSPSRGENRYGRVSEPLTPVFWHLGVHYLIRSFRNVVGSLQTARSFSLELTAMDKVPSIEECCVPGRSLPEWSCRWTRTKTDHCRMAA